MLAPGPGRILEDVEQMIASLPKQGAVGIEGPGQATLGGQEVVVRGVGVAAD